jgi:hypothetical protein
MRNTFAAGFIRAISEIRGNMKARCPVAALERSESVVGGVAASATMSNPRQIGKKMEGKR